MGTALRCEIMNGSEYTATYGKCFQSTCIGRVHQMTGLKKIIASFRISQMTHSEGSTWLKYFYFNPPPKPGTQLAQYYLYLHYAALTILKKTRKCS